jgi:hypothetical protein
MSSVQPPLRKTRRFCQRLAAWGAGDVGKPAALARTRDHPGNLETTLKHVIIDGHPEKESAYARHR